MPNTHSFSHLPVRSAGESHAVYKLLSTVIPAEKLCAVWCDFKSKALSSIYTVVPLAVMAARHVTGGLSCSGGAGGSCRKHRVQ